MADPHKGKFHGTENVETLSRISQDHQTATTERVLRLGLEAADSITDRTIPLFSRGYSPAFAGINTFLKAPYCEDAGEVGQYDAAFIGEPYDGGTTFRPGARWAPQAVRRISALYDSYNLDSAVDLQEELNICDMGDVHVIPSNIEKTFDQCTKAIEHIYTAGRLPGDLRGRSQPRFPQRPGHCAPHRRQRRYHSHRPPLRL